MEMKEYKFIDLSGYAFTGKHAVIDLLREFKGYFVPHFEFEFNLLRVQGGILDLEDALFNDWSPIRSDAAIRRFKRLEKRFGDKNSYLSPKSWFTAVGTNYDEHFNGQFHRLTREYMDNLIQESWRSPWPYPAFDFNGLELFFQKLMRKIRRGKDINFEVNLSFPDNFVAITSEYLQKLLTSNVPPGFSTIVMHNAFEPFNPQRSLKYFKKGKAIVVDRDPRDNFIQASNWPPLKVSVEVFVKRYRIYRMATEKFRKEEKNVLRIKFEDLVLNYGSMLRSIIAFLEEDEGIHQYPKEYFDPAISIKNIGLWKRHHDKSEIDYIYKELKEYCFCE